VKDLLKEEVTRATRGYTSDFFACDDDVIFLKIVASPARGGGYTWRQFLTKSVVLSQKIQLIEFLTIFSCNFPAVASPVRG